MFWERLLGSKVCVWDSLLMVWGFWVLRVGLWLGLSWWYGSKCVGDARGLIKMGNLSETTSNDIAYYEQVQVK